MERLLLRSEDIVPSDVEVVAVEAKGDLGLAHCHNCWG